MTAVQCYMILIAGILNRNGLQTGNGHRRTRERVTSMRSNYRIPVFKAAENGTEPWLNPVPALPRSWKVAPKTRGLAAEAGAIEAIHSLAGGPLDLCPSCPRNILRAIPRRAGAPEPKIPHRIATRTTKPLLFSHIDRWVF